MIVQIDKQIKRTLFLKQLLKHFGITWKLKVKEKEDFSIKYSYFPMFKCRYMFKNKSTLDIRVNKGDVTFGIDYIDYLHDISIRAFDDFIYYARIKNNKTYNNVLYAINRIFGKLPRHRYWTIDDIDFNDLIQNMILDGIPLDKFPKIENVL